MASLPTPSDAHGGNPFSRNNFLCGVREPHHVCKISGRAIAQFARSWLPHCL